MVTGSCIPISWDGAKRRGSFSDPRGAGKGVQEGYDGRVVHFFAEPVVMRTPDFIAACAAVALTLASSSAMAQEGVDPRPPNGATQKPAVAGQTDAPELKSNVAFEV